MPGLLGGRACRLRLQGVFGVVRAHLDRATCDRCIHASVDRPGDRDIHDDRLDVLDEAPPISPGLVVLRLGLIDAGKEKEGCSHGSEGHHGLLSAANGATRLHRPICRGQRVIISGPITAYKSSLSMIDLPDQATALAATWVEGAARLCLRGSRHTATRVDFEQRGTDPFSGKIDEVPDLLGHETPRWIDDADGNRIGLEVGKDGYERSNGKIWSGLME